MSLIINILIGVVAALHVYFLVLESLGILPTAQTFGMRRNIRCIPSLAANQGLYNGFLAAD